MAGRRIAPFHDQACRSCPPLDDLALSIAAELRPAVDVAAAEEALDDLAFRAMPAAGLTPHGQGYALAEATARLRPASRGAGTAAFALDEVLRSGSGHPALLALVQAEVARRAGMPFALAGFGARLLVVHRRARPAPVALEPGRAGALLAAQDLPERLSWRCSHQAAFCVLGAAAAEAATCGDLRAAVHALELRLALPVDGETLESLERELRSMRARLN